MRIPIPIVISAGIITVSITWWLGTRKLDFLKEPSTAELETIRQEAIASLITSSSNKDAISIQTPSPEPSDITPQNTNHPEPIEIGEITATPTLDTYSDRAPEGSEILLRLAASLENAQSPERAILALERIIDLSPKTTPQQSQEAIRAIQRLRQQIPPWNPDPQKAQLAIIHVDTEKKFSEHLPEILETITKELNTSSSGIIRFYYKLHIGKQIKTSKAPTTTLVTWLTGDGDEPASTEILSLTTDNPDTLHNELLKTIFNLIRSHLSKTTSYNPVPETLDTPLPALQSHITRLLWNELAQNLNPKKSSSQSPGS